MTPLAPVYRGEDGQWYWRVVDARNGQIVMTGGEGYTRKWSAKRARTKALKRA